MKPQGIFSRLRLWLTGHSCSCEGEAWQGNMTREGRSGSYGASCLAIYGHFCGNNFRQRTSWQCLLPLGCFQETLGSGGVALVLSTLCFQPLRCSISAFLCVVSYAFFPHGGIKSALAWDTVSPVMGMLGLGQSGPVSSSTTDNV